MWKRKGPVQVKTWITGHKGQLRALGIAAAMAAFFSLGWYAGIHAADRETYAALWQAMAVLPDPEQCALCGAGMRYHAPCLVDLSTGQMGEMAVYTHHPSHQGELAPMELQQTGTFRLRPCAGLTAIQDTCAHTYQVVLPKKRELMNPALFCRECRRLLAGAGLAGYVIVDLYDLDHIQTYPMRDEVIRDYRVSVTGGRENTLNVCVEGFHFG